MTKELNEYRRQLVAQLEDAAARFREACLAVKDPYASLGVGSWNVHQVAVHTRDVQMLVYGARARRTAEEENPEFPNFDSETYLAEQYDRTESLEKILNSLVENVRALAAMLRRLPPEAWARESRHAIMGSGFTLQIWVERGLAHIEEHIETVKNGKR
ncbi:MAG: DinB family protein [Anaerolineales bacterium]